MQLGGLDLFAPEGPLFRTSSGKPAQVERLMFERFSAVAGLPKSTANTLRQTASTNYRADPVKRITEPAVMDHSAGVAAAHYDKGQAGLAVDNDPGHIVQRLLTNSFQVQHRQWLDKKNEGSALTFESIGYKIDDEIMLKWSERLGGEDKRGKDEAREYMRQAGEASNPIKDITSRCNMLPGHREIMSQDMLRDSCSEVYARVAPPKDFPRDTQGRQACMHACDTYAANV